YFWAGVYETSSTSTFGGPLSPRFRNCDFTVRFASSEYQNTISEREPEPRAAGPPPELFLTCNSATIFHASKLPARTATRSFPTTRTASEQLKFGLLEQLPRCSNSTLDQLSPPRISWNARKNGEKTDRPGEPSPESLAPGPQVRLT